MSSRLINDILHVDLSFSLGHIHDSIIRRNRPQRFKKKEAFTIMDSIENHHGPSENHLHVAVSLCTSSVDDLRYVYTLRLVGYDSYSGV